MQDTRVASRWMRLAEPHSSFLVITLLTPQQPTPWPSQTLLKMQRQLSKPLTLLYTCRNIPYRYVIVLCPGVRCGRSFGHCKLSA